MDTIVPPEDSAIARRRRLYALIKNEDLSDRVIDELLPNGEPLQYEKQMWDYKASLPTLPAGVKPNEATLRQHSVAMAEVVKDVAAFYNSYGGYLVVGVRDNPREIAGFAKHFDCDELNKKIKAATKHDVDCHYSVKSVTCKGGVKTIGLLLVPQRPDDLQPAQFLKSAPESENGKRAYRAQDIMFRDGHECRAAKLAEEFNALCSQGRRHFLPPQQAFERILALDNNLGPRDPGFIRFIRRERYMTDLWQWLCDRYAPGKLLAGVGGVGKTTLAREFAEDVIRGSPMGFERVIWLSAKKRFYTASINEYVLATRVDFSDTDSLLRSLLYELGHTEEMVDPEWGRSDLMDEVIDSLKIIPSLVIVDDVDSLDPPEEQNAVFHTMLQAVGQTMGAGNGASRVILTARLNLGAAAAQLIRVSGLELAEFEDFVAMTAQEMGLPSTALGGKRDLQRFHRVTDGSPIFATSILRLVELGDNLGAALERWKGNDGQQVRSFAFERELQTLTESQVRTLYTLCILGETSQVELRQITQSNDVLLRDDLLELRKYHLLALGSDIPGFGPKLSIPETIRVMSGLIKDRVRDPKVIESECARTRKGAPRLGVNLGGIVHRVIAFWRDDKPEEALAEIKVAMKRAAENPDLLCLLGRAYLQLESPLPSKADAAFLSAHKFDCQRTELMGLWIEAKKLLGDWIGLIEVTRLADQIERTSENVYVRAEAFNELAENSNKMNNPAMAMEQYLQGAKDIDQAFANKQATGRVPELREMRSNFFQEYVRLTNRLADKRDRHIEVWLATMEAFRCYVRSNWMIRLGLDRLTSWWSAVEGRAKFDSASANQLHGQIKQIDHVIATLGAQVLPDDVLMNHCRTVSEGLASRLERYRAQLSR